MGKFWPKIRYFQWNSYIARKILSLYYKEGKSYRIPFGPLQGKSIYYRSDITFHTMLGMWELEHITILQKLLNSGLLPQSPVFCDIGANIGSYTLWLSSLKNNKGMVYAFEPVPQSANALRRNALINQLKNVEIIERACSNITGTVDFFIGNDHHSSSLNSEWAKGRQQQVEKITVETITLDDFFLSDQRPLPDFIKMDIEGGAVFALPGCRNLVKQKQSLFFIESHTPDEDRAIGDFMLEHQYAGYRLNNHKWVMDAKKTYPHTDGVWGSILLCSEKSQTQVNNIIHNLPV